MDESTNSSETEAAVAAPHEPPSDALPIVPPLPEALPPPLALTRPVGSRLRAKPVAEGDRFAALDVVRGFALCGILLVNMENFAMVREARYDPALGGGDSAFDHFVWMLTFVFADTKFIAIFTMLFGAGIAVANYRGKDGGLTGVWAVHVRRMLFLLAVGAAHGMYLWRGDILYFYAFWGLWLYFAPRIPTLGLAIAGLGLYAIFMHEFAVQLYQGNEGYSWWEREVFRGPWHMQYEYRLQSERYYLTRLPFDFATHLLGLMLFGMALFKSGFLPGRWPMWGYFLATLATLPLGAWLVVHGSQLQAGFATSNDALLFVVGSLLLSLGYMGAAIFLTKVLGACALGGFVALGRMAFTNYLLQTVICTTLFYGYGLGLFERVTRGEQFAIVIAILAFQMIFSQLWLRYFAFGPLEWVWRSFSYWRLQPLRRSAPAVPPAAPASEAAIGL